MTTLYCRMKHFLVDIAIHHFLGKSRAAHEFQGTTPTLLLQPSCVHHTIWHLPLLSHTAFEPFLFRDYPIKLSQIYLSTCPWCPSVFCQNFYIIGRSSDFFFLRETSFPEYFLSMLMHPRQKELAGVPHPLTNTIKMGASPN